MNATYKNQRLITGISIFLAVVLIFVSYNLHLQNEKEFLFEEKIEYNSEPLPKLENNQLYSFYSNMERPLTDDYTAYILSPYDDDFLHDNFYGYTEREALSYCRSNISYEKEVNTEYPKYPIETIDEGSGDCEDKSILFASIMYLNGYDVSLVRFKDHMTVVVDGYLHELTSDLCRYSLEDAEAIYPVYSHPILELDWKGSIYKYNKEYFTSLEIYVYNYGNVEGEADVFVSDNSTSNKLTVDADAFSICKIDYDIKVEDNTIKCWLDTQV